MKKFTRTLSLMLAIVMVFGMAAPAVPGEGNGFTDVTIHKVLMESLTGWLKGDGLNETGTGAADGDGKVTSNGIHYTGQDLTGQFGGYFGAGAEEIAGVTFTYWKITEAQYNMMMKTSSNYDTIAKVNTYLADAENLGTTTSPTTTTGVSVTGLANGYYWFVENMGSYTGPQGQTLSAAAAVPFGLELPMLKADGTYFGTGTNDALHVYPKNTQVDKPVIDKDFADLEEGEGQDPIRDYTVGDIVLYEVTTTVPQGVQYKTLKWSDTMTDGLTYNMGSLAITMNGTPLATTSYTLAETQRGFILQLTEAGIDAMNEAAETASVEFNIKYNATINGNAVVDVNEKNHITLHYGNNPTQGNTPVIVYPLEDKITVTKTWAEGTAPKGVTATFDLYNAHETNSTETPLQTVTLPIDGDWTYTFEGLNPELEHRVVERYIDNYSAEYTTTGDGIVNVTNHKDNNPGPIEPETPEVRTGGKKFVKTGALVDGKKSRLAGAQFVITNEAEQYLAAKTADTVTDQQTAYIAAEAAYQAAVLAATTDNPDTENIANLLAARNAAFNAAQMEWQWVATQAEAQVFISDANGFFQVKGLEYGSYKLVEIAAPAGYAILTTPTPFEVNALSFTTDDVNIPSHPDSTTNDAQEVPNVAITIPQTGGIGTIIFGVVGVTLMGGAVVAFKKSEDEE